MLRTLLLLVTVLMVATSLIWLGFIAAINGVTIVFLKRTWLGLLLVIERLLRGRPPWAHRSLLNYARMFAARYTPLKLRMTYGIA